MPAASSTLTRCARCLRPAPTEAFACPTCGAPLRESPPPQPASRPPALTRPPISSGVPVSPSRTWTSDAPDARGDSVNGRFVVLAVGVVLAPILTLTPLLQYMGWFLASLVHETGHTAMAWLFGCGAFPAIRIDGHAAAFHREQQPLLCALVLAGMLWFAWASRGRPARVAAAAGAIGLYLLAACTRLHEALFLLAGHLGELGFAAYAFSRAMDGGFTGTMAERCAHSGVGCYLIGRTGVLAIGLATSEAAREAYAGNGSFGLENDLLRFSREMLHTPSPAPGALLLLAIALAIVTGAVMKAARGSRELVGD